MPGKTTTIYHHYSSATGPLKNTNVREKKRISGNWQAAEIAQGETTMTRGLFYSDFSPTHLRKISRQSITSFKVKVSQHWASKYKMVSSGSKTKTKPFFDPVPFCCIARFTVAVNTCVTHKINSMQDNWLSNKWSPLFFGIMGINLKLIGQGCDI